MGSFNLGLNLIYCQSKMKLLLFTFFLSYSNAFTLPKIFKSGMVLQAHPTDAVIWGFLDGNTNPVDISGDCSIKGEKFTFTKTYFPNKDDDKFQSTVPGEEGVTCDFTIYQEGSEDVVLNDVIYGDVWVCSGQSNMQWNMGGIFNSDEEIAAMADYPNIRMYFVKLMTSDSPQDDLVAEQWTKWAQTSESNMVKLFSAVCVLTAKYMADQMGKDKVFGLIESNWGGTIIEAWMPQEPLDLCEINPNDNGDPNNANRNSVLYNAMIHPLIRLSIKGALWYQGESNGGHNRDKYQCTFPAMINEWRNLWSTNTPTSNKFPFGFMQLSTWNANDKSPNFPVIRWHQTADEGFVPNSIMENVFMGVALDTYDAESGIHPRNKQLVTKRLATAGLNVAYGLTSYPSNGPIADIFFFNPVDDIIQVGILYDKKFTWNPVETEGFYVCRLDGDFYGDYSQCNNRVGAWEKLPEGSIKSVTGQSISLTIPSNSNGLAYLWETTPVLGTGALPMYADDEFGLPGAPWVRSCR